MKLFLTVSSNDVLSSLHGEDDVNVDLSVGVGHGLDGFGVGWGIYWCRSRSGRKFDDA